MIQSMTGFGSAENNEFRVEIRSLNHRFIDIAIKMPPYMNQYEIPLRNSIKERFKRGRFDVFISATNNNQVQIKINKELARNIYSNLKDLQKEFTIPGKINMETLLGYREILIEEEPQYDIDALYASFNEAISNLESMRMREGALLSEELLKRIRLLDKMNNEIKLLVPNEIAKWREKFTERLKSVLDTGGTDANRIIQEAAILADKFDIYEEVSRVESHIKQFIEILDNG